jgi:AraC-like DNA-binding protein
MDPLTQLIKLLRPHGLRWKRLHATGDWALQFRGHDGMSFCMVGKGMCEIQLEGQQQEHLGEGDLVLLVAPPRWVLMKGPDAQLEDFERVYAGVDGNTAFIGQTDSGPVTQLLGGEISFEPGNSKLLRDVLPAMLRIPSLESHSGRLQTLLEWIGNEAVSNRPGRDLILERLLEVMLVEALRLNPHDASITHGVLAAMADPQLATALHVMHAQFQRNWTVRQLASVSGMSRSVFAERFARVSGLTPIDYLLHLRMAIAKDMLLFTGKRPSEVAFLCGYNSIASFSTAFRRIVGSSPGAYAKVASNDATRGR